MNATRAFTLIEMLIALAISGIVLAAINTVFFGAIRLRNRMTAVTEQTLPVDRAVATMKRDLLGIVPIGVLAGPMGTDSANSGMKQPPLLEIFTASGALSAEVPWADVQKIDYLLQEPTNKAAASGMDLIRGVTRDLLSVNIIPPEPQLLIGDVKSLVFSYYDGTNWNDTWSTTLSNVPVAIKVALDFTPPKSGGPVIPRLQFLVPIVTWAITNQSITNQIAN